jgi:DNA-directed RNA polymerase specialized sigma24 family protein
LIKENKYIRSLVQSAQDGNNAILKQLFEMNLKRIHSLSLRLMGNFQLAKELTVSAFLTASNRIKSYEPDILFSDWLILNTIQDALEKMKNEGKQIKKQKKGGDEEEISALQIEPIDREILNLNNFERIAIVLNKIENIPIEMVAKYTKQADENEVQKIIDDAI